MKMSGFYPAYVSVYLRKFTLYGSKSLRLVDSQDNCDHWSGKVFGQLRVMAKHTENIQSSR